MTPIHELAIDGDSIIFRGETLSLPSYRPLRPIGIGANGIVILCENTLLKRNEALKVWVKLKAKDLRDKFEQGMEEARKATAAASGVVPTVFSAGEIGKGHFYATMEYIEGDTLAEYIQKTQNPFDLAVVAQWYVTAIERTSERGHIHGDPHTRNVIVRGVYDKQAHLAILDFGTSRFTSPGRLVERHWHVVDETLDRLYRSHHFYRQIKGKPESTGTYERIKYYNEVARLMRQFFADIT